MQQQSDFDGKLTGILWITRLRRASKAGLIDISYCREQNGNQCCLVE